MSRQAVLAVALLLASVTLGAPLPAASQTVQGVLVQHPGGAALAGGSVYLIDRSDAVVDSARSAADGRFTLRGPTAGTYALHFSRPGYASVPSEPITLEAGATVAYRFAVPLIGGHALERISQMVNVEEKLQSDIVELCGERPRSWEAGILIGAVRRRPGGEPLAGAIVAVEAPGPEGGEPFYKATVSSANGVYVICNIPLGVATARTELAGYRTDEGPVEVHAGTIGWYDFFLRPY